jgi:hypothetical protein
VPPDTVIEPVGSSSTLRPRCGGGESGPGIRSRPGPGLVVLGSDHRRLFARHGAGACTRTVAPLQSQAVVYSDKKLQLPGAAIGVTTLSGNATAYRFRYNGLRPLLYSRDRWFLLPVDWTHDGGVTVLVIRDDDSNQPYSS